MTVKSILALGSNLGERGDILTGAVAAIAAGVKVRLQQISPVVQSKAVGGPDQPDYLNLVIEIETDLDPRELLRFTQSVEAKYHRERTVRWGPRTLDIDIITFGDLRCDDEILTLPHPRAHERAFVLQPWAWMDRAATLSGRPVEELAAVAEDLPGLSRCEGTP